MGQAKLRAEARAMGQPWPQDLHRCPKCASRRTLVTTADPMGLSHVATRWGVCAECRCAWEAYPDDWTGDVVAATPCDNCAFAPGSPELADRAGWQSMLAKLKLGAEFRCHKGAPMIVNQETGADEFDEAWINAHGRSCAGFVRAMQQWPDWLEQRYSGPVHVLTKHDQDIVTSASLCEAEEAYVD